MTLADRPLRVLHVTAVETSNYYLNNLAAAAPPGEFELLAVTLGEDRGFKAGLEARGARAWALGARSRLAYPRALGRLWRIVREEAVDVLHLHLFEPTVLGLIVAGGSGRPAVVSRHHSDAVHRLPPGAKRSAYLALERWINRRARHLIAPSLRVREVLVGREGVPASKVSIIPYGQDPGRFEAARREDPREYRRLLAAGSPSLVCVARLHPEKGHRVLLEAFATVTREHPAATLSLVGTGAEREALASQARALGLEAAVRFLGWRDDALAILRSADLVVHPSLHEALPSAVIEAVMLGCPVVATDVSGVRDILGENGEFGAVVPPADPVALARAIRDTLGALEPARARAERGRLHVTATMDASRVARLHAECYRMVAGGRG